MTFRIVKASDEARTILKLSGRIRARDVEGLCLQMEGGPKSVVLDLQEVTLVDIEVVRFLGICEAKGIELSHCSPYIREWVFREHAAGKEE